MSAGSSRSCGPSLVADVLLGCEEPRIFTPPLRRLTRKTSLGFAVIEFAEDILGMALHPWQKWFYIHALELLPDGTPRFRTILLLVARQNGKTLLMQILALFFMYVRGVPLVIGTAQNLDIAEEVWEGTVDIAKAVPELAAEVAKVDQTNGKKALRLKGGERYKVQAANRRGGRSLSGDFVLMDELREHQNWDAWGAITKTTMARALAIILAASNAGDLSSVVLAHLRVLGHVALGNPDGLVVPEGEDDDLDDMDLDDESLGIFEWSAPPGCSRSDRDGWRQANPSLGYTTTERAIRSALRTDPDATFRTEVLCQWVTTTEPLWALFDEQAWRAGAVPPGRYDGPFTYAVEVTPNRDGCSVAAAGTYGDRVGVEVLHSGTYDEDEVLARLVKVAATAKGIVIDPNGPAKTLIRPLFELHNIETLPVSSQEFASACESFYDAHRSDLAHLEVDPALDAAVAAARSKRRGDGFVFDRSGRDVTPLTAAALARWGHMEIPDPEVVPMVAWR
jgi:hypothetical protein